MKTLPLCSVNRALNGLNIHNGIAVLAGHNAQALLPRASASCWIPVYKLEIYDVYSLTSHGNSRFLLTPSAALKSNASRAAGFFGVKYWKLLCYYSSRWPKPYWYHKHFESVTLRHKKMSA